jgi:hypothetical protein
MLSPARPDAPLLAARRTLPPTPLWAIGTTIDQLRTRAAYALTWPAGLMNAPDPNDPLAVSLAGLVLGKQAPPPEVRALFDYPDGDDWLVVCCLGCRDGHITYEHDAYVPSDWLPAQLEAGTVDLTRDWTTVEDHLRRHQNATLYA